MTALASLRDLAEYRGIDVDENDVQATRTLEVVSSFLRLRTGQHLDTTEHDHELHGTWDRCLYLPQIPVQAVDSVSIREWGLETYAELTESWTWARDGALERGSWWGGPTSRVRVVYTAGYEPDHPRLQDIANLVATLAARSLERSARTDITSKRLGSFEVTYADVESVGLMGEEADLIEALKNPRHS